MPILFPQSLPFPLLTPGLTKERQTPTTHSLRAYGIHVSGSFILALHRSHLSHSFPGGCAVPKLWGIPAFEIPKSKHKHMPKAKACSQKLSEPRGIIMRACRVACHDSQQALILAFCFIITLYHSKAPRYFTVRHRWALPSVPDRGEDELLEGP